MRVQNWRWAEPAFTGSGANLLFTIVFRAVGLLFFSLNYSHCGQRLVGSGWAVIMAFGVAWHWFISHGLGFRPCLDSPLGVCQAAGGILLGWSGTHNTNFMHILFFFSSLSPFMLSCVSCLSVQVGSVLDMGAERNHTHVLVQ